MGEENISIKPIVSFWTESDYLIISNRNKCKNLLEKKEMSDEDIIDFLIAMHLVLEIGLNTLYRHLSMLSLKKLVSEFDVIKNIDNVSFIDKTILFIYNSKFNFGKHLDKATEYHKIIGTMRDSSGTRNQLFHGHTISTIYKEAKQKDSELKKKIGPNYLKEQIGKFRFIIQGMRFYIDCLDSTLTPQGKEDLKQAFLIDNFLLL